MQAVKRKNIFAYLENCSAGRVSGRPGDVARLTLEELWEKCGGIVLAGRDKVVAKVVVDDGIVECNDTLSGEWDLLVPWPFPLFASRWG